MTIAPPSPPYIPAKWKGEPNSQPTILAICLHGTVGHDDPGSARQVARYFQTTSRPASAHYVRDPRETIQSVFDHTIAYHCGGHNKGVIGYEFCDEQVGPASRWFDEDSTAILKGAAKDIARLCAAYHIEIRRPSIAELKEKGPHGIYGHNDSRLAFGGTTHTDPKDFPWDYFLRLVKAEYNLLVNAVPGAPKPAPASWSKFFHDPDYILNNSPEGLRKGAKAGYKAIDLDWHITGDGKWACVHWPDLRGFYFPNGKPVQGTGSVHTYRWDEIKTFRSKNGISIHSAAYMLAVAKELGYTRIEVEVKDTPSVEQFKALKKIAAEVGIKIVVKRLTSLPGWKTALTNAGKAGLTTMVLPRGTVKASKSLWPYIDYVRGNETNKIIWT